MFKLICFSLLLCVSLAAQEDVTIELTSDPNPSALGSHVTFTATLSTNAATGTLTWLDGANAFYTNTLSDGAASVTTSGLICGAHLVTVVYSGDENYWDAISGILTQRVSLPDGFVYVPFGGAAHHTGLEDWPLFFSESYTSNQPSSAVDWAAWQGWRAFSTNFHLADARLKALEGGMTVTSTNPPVISLSGLLSLPSRTIPSNTASTFASPPPLVCADSNYLYISVGTNLWKRAALSTW